MRNTSKQMRRRAARWFAKRPRETLGTIDVRVVVDSVRRAMDVSAGFSGLSIDDAWLEI